MLSIITVCLISSSFSRARCIICVMSATGRLVFFSFFFYSARGLIARAHDIALIKNAVAFVIS